MAVETNRDNYGVYVTGTDVGVDWGFSRFYDGSLYICVGSENVPIRVEDAKNLLRILSEFDNPDDED